jgi:hypothetical protein
MAAGNLKESRFSPNNIPVSCRATCLHEILRMPAESSQQIQQAGHRTLFGSGFTLAENSVLR